MTITYVYIVQMCVFQSWCLEQSATWCTYVTIGVIYKKIALCVMSVLKSDASPSVFILTHSANYGQNMTDNFVCK
jgi:hypothetical protein